MQRRLRASGNSAEAGIIMFQFASNACFARTRDLAAAGRLRIGDSTCPRIARAHDKAVHRMRVVVRASSFA
jgi:hypothetical protein